MDGTAILNTASDLLEAYGENAKFHIAEQIDFALQSDDGAGYDHWCMVAKAVSLMSMARTEASVARPEPVATPAVTPTLKVA
jgi:hypothetical protein